MLHRKLESLRFGLSDVGGNGAIEMAQAVQHLADGYLGANGGAVHAPAARFRGRSRDTTRREARFSVVAPYRNSNRQIAL